jgi:hypothetical protein
MAATADVIAHEHCAGNGDAFLVTPPVSVNGRTDIMLDPDHREHVITDQDHTERQQPWVPRLGNECPEGTTHAMFASRTGMTAQRCLPGKYECGDGRVLLHLQDETGVTVSKGCFQIERGVDCAQERGTSNQVRCVAGVAIRVCKQNCCHAAAHPRSVFVGGGGGGGGTHDIDPELEIRPLTADNVNLPSQPNPKSALRMQAPKR